ncbi:cyclin-dependent kinase 4 inhibitor C isoform X2 [Betta splendens]|uniref:Cyclin-dependent kinase 4 inhibitor C isoform X2 n=1 Tax=Betta splendens TaxID=158456 RepID=A0A6P7MCM6_BETSP|nr:cyclin-dependent kinase 4 inhibitor C isoform X2 [Betta splendens]XP_055363992.1 cyclin-dependent kinase 4 inhibitor C isoform X2 [Betta splendens]
MADSSLSDQLCKASATGNLRVVLLILENGADVNGFNKFKRTALQVVMLGHAAVADALLRNGADPNVRDPLLGLCVIHDAAREGFVDTVRVLIGHGADVNVADARGNLPLHLAAREGHVEVVEALLGLTAEPRAVNGEGVTAAQLARSCGKEDAASCIEMYLTSRE